MIIEYRIIKIEISDLKIFLLNMVEVGILHSNYLEHAQEYSSLQYSFYPIKKIPKVEKKFFSSKLLLLINEVLSLFIPITFLIFIF